VEASGIDGAKVPDASFKNRGFDGGWCELR